MVKFGEIDNYIVVTWTEDDMEICLDLNLPCADASAYLPGEPSPLERKEEDNSTASKPPTNDTTDRDGDLPTNNTSGTSTKHTPAVPEFETKAYNRIMWMKPAVVKVLLELGYVVHSTDIDLAYAAKPVWESYLSYLELGMDGIVADAAFQTEGKPNSDIASPINSGNFVALPTQATLALFSTWVGQSTEQVDRGGNQKGLLKLFKEGKFELCVEEADCLEGIQARDQIQNTRIENNSNAAVISDDISKKPNLLEELDLEAIELPPLQLILPNITSYNSSFPAIIRVYHPPWWSINQNYCVLSGEGPLQVEIDPCWPSLMYLHPICTPKGGDRVELKIDVLREAGFWFLEDDDGCPMNDEQVLAISGSGKGGYMQESNGELNQLKNDRVIERCLPTEVRRPGREMAVTKCRHQLAFV